jgi:hypothetical protein
VGISSDHGNIPDNSIKEIFSNLGLSEGESGGGSFSEPKIYFYLGSPAVMKVKCNQSPELADEHGWVVLNKRNNSSCKIVLTGVGDGEYHLIGGTDDNWQNWDAWEGKIENRKIISWNTEVNQILFKPITGENWWTRLRYLILKLKEKYPDNQNLKLALKAIDEKRLGQVRAQIMVFRRKYQEYPLMVEIIKSLYNMGQQENANSRSIGDLYKRIWEPRGESLGRQVEWWMLGEEIFGQ